MTHSSLGDGRPVPALARRRDETAPPLTALCRFEEAGGVGAIDAASEALSQGVALPPGSGFAGPRMGSDAVGQENLAGPHLVQHLLGAAAVGELEGDRQAVGVDQGVDLGGQAAARATL